VVSLLELDVEERTPDRVLAVVSFSTRTLTSNRVGIGLGGLS
jgi:hypothetical protein